MVWRFILLIITLLGGLNKTDQEEYPVSWHVYSEKTDNQSFDIVFEAFISNGWVIYAMASSEDGPVPTTFDFDKNENVRIVGKTEEKIKPESKFEPLFDTDVLKFSQKAMFTQKVTQLGKSSVVNGNITYMACDGTKCLPPTDVPFVALLK